MKRDRFQMPYHS